MNCVSMAIFAVTLFVRVWIEILRNDMNQHHERVTLFVRVWIEIEQ